jgi:hypothetical protein
MQTHSMGSKSKHVVLPEQAVKSPQRGQQTGHAQTPFQDDSVHLQRMAFHD